MSKQNLGKVSVTIKSEYDSSISYERLDIVAKNGMSYIAKKDNKGIPVDNTDYWLMLVQKPIKGIDYFDEVDKKEIISKITDLAESDFNIYFNGKILDFDKHVVAKIEEFDNNSIEVTKDFNDNVSVKITEFNENAESKKISFNQNTEDQTKTFNENATNKIEIYNTNANAKVTEYNANAEEKTNEFNENASSYDKDIKDNSNRIKRLETAIFDSGTASGSSINIEDSTLTEFIETKVDGVGNQITTKGKNTLENRLKQSKTSYGITFSYNKNGTYTLNGKNDGTRNSSLFFNSSTDLIKYEAGEYYSLLQPKVGMSIVASYVNAEGVTKYITMSSSNIDHFTLEEDIEAEIYLQVSKDVRVTFLNDIFYPMISKVPIQISDYEPYSNNGPSPSPGYEQPIEVIKEKFNLISCTENTFDPFVIKSHPHIVIIDDGTIEVSGTATTNGFMSTAKTLKEMCKSLDIGDEVFLYGETDFHENNNPNTKNAIYLQGVNFSWIFGDSKIISKEMLESNVVLYGGYNETSHIKLAISKNKILTEYEQYQSSTTSIVIPENEFAGKLSDTFKDEFKISFNEDDAKYHLYLYKKIGKKIFDGSENWGIDTYFTSTDGSTHFKLLTNHYLINTKCKSNYFVYQDGREQNNGNINQNSPAKFVLISMNTIDNVEDFKNWLSIHQTETYYVLDTPYTIDLGLVDMPRTYYPITNVFTDCPLLPNIEVEYYRDFKGTINVMQNDIDTLESDVATLKEQVAQLTTTTSNLVNNINESEASE